MVEKTLGSCLTLTVAQAAKLLGISRNSAYEAAKRGQLPILKIGSRILVPRVALEEMLTRSAAKAGTVPANVGAAGAGQRAPTGPILR
jgi:excisionase family DNA binding protein